MKNNSNQLYLDSLHRNAGAKMVPFGAWTMPVQYTSIIKEHNHTRQSSGLFDVSHMHQFLVTGEGKSVVNFLLRLVPSDLRLLKRNRQRYSAFLNEDAGVIDDLMIAKISDNQWFIVSNANCAAVVDNYLAQHNRYNEVSITTINNQILFALQGPKSQLVLEDILTALLTESNSDLCLDDTLGQHLNQDIVEKIQSMKYLDNIQLIEGDIFARVSRSGYSGEDGFEISVPNEFGKVLFTKLLQHSSVLPAGLGARDTLRIEAGLCLYGNDMDQTVSPIEASLGWIVSPSRKSQDTTEFLGRDIILEQIKSMPRIRIGFFPNTKRPVRSGANLIGIDDAIIGKVTSGTYSPTLQRNIAMGLVSYDYHNSMKRIFTEQNGQKIEMVPTNMPFVEHNFLRK